MTRWLLVAVACVAACRSSGAKSRRMGSAAPVQLVEQVALPDAGGRGSGTISDEQEPNDADDVATPLPLGGTVRAKLDPEGDVDRFRIDVDRAGALAVTIAPVDQDLVLELEDGAGNLLARSARGGARIVEGVPNFGVTPGRYIAVVRAAPKKKQPAKPAKPQKKAGKAGPEPPPPAAPTYEITAQLGGWPAGAEREPDDDRGTANDVLPDGASTVTGYVGWAGDRDVWKLSVETLSAKNAIDVEVSAVEGVALELEIADGIGAPLVDRKLARPGPAIVRGLVPIVPQGGSPFHYLTVRGAGSNPETAYQLRVTAHLIDVDAEVEPDDTPERAMPFPADRKAVHATWTPGDVDCFALPSGQGARTVEVSVVPTQGELDLSLEILVDGKPVATAAKAAKGAEKRATAQVPPGGHAVARVKGSDAATAEGRYDLVVAETGE